MLASFDVFAVNWTYKTRGNLGTRLSSYTNNKSKNYGQASRAQFEQTTSFTSNFSAMNQLRWNSNSISSDLSEMSTPSKKENFETYLGENYLKYKASSWVMQIGYQEIVWGEAFGLNYADIINPKDKRETLYAQSSEARIPLLLFNGKYFYSIGNLSGSLQLLFSPEPRFSKNLPLELFAKGIFTQDSLKIVNAKSPKIFTESEIGGKLSTSYSGIDFSIFGYSYLSRDPYYLLDSASLTNITLLEQHAPVKSYGLSFAKSIFDFVFRTDIVLTQNKITNYIQNDGSLQSYSANVLDTLISVDTPTYKKFSAIIIYAKSSASETAINSFRKQDEQYFIGKISKDFGSEKTFELAYTRELISKGQSIQSLLSWPINSTTELKLGGEFYFGNDQSDLKKLKNISNVFFSIKNYFQL
jgi:hypothetical protein